jgi:hypothetical protein
VEGLKELRKALREFGGAELVKRLNAVGKRVTNRVVDQSKPDIPRRTGRLASTARGTADSVLLGGASVRYTEFVYWQRRHRWYHRELDRLEDSGKLAAWYDEGIGDLARELGLDVT